MFGRVRLQLTAWYAGALLLILLVIGGSAYALVRNDLDGQINSSLERTSVGLAGNALTAQTPVAQPTPRPGHDENEHDSEEGDHRLAGISTDVFFVVTQDGQVQSNPRNVNLTGIDLAALEARAGDGENRVDISAGGRRFRILTAREEGPGSVYLHVGRSLDARDHQLDTLATVLSLGGIAGLVLSTSGGFWLAGRTLTPIRTSMETQRRFVSDASHELRTPIATVRANNELLLRHHDQTVEANLDQVEAIAAESEHMSKLVADLLTLARADEGRFEIARERFDLGELSNEVGRDMQPIAESRGIGLTLDVSAAPVEADRQRARQLLVILLDNALKYTPRGGSVTVRCRRAGKRVELAVSDTGPGIAAEHHARVFDRFYRVDAGRAKSEGGSGLGLAIARWIAEVHGGRISLESAPGKGSTFTVRLPGAS